MKPLLALLAGFAVMWIWSKHRCKPDGTSKKFGINDLKIPGFGGFGPPDVVGGNSTTVNSGERTSLNPNITDTGGRARFW